MFTSTSPRITRRALLQTTGSLAGAALIHRWSPFEVSAAQTPGAAAGVAALDARRAGLAKEPMTRTRLSDRLEMLAGPGGNVVVLHGPDGLVVVDNFVRPAWPQLKAALAAIGGPVKVAIDTHWHFDHVDNNASLHRAGASILAHANTKARLSEPHDVLGLHMDPEPPEALPTEIFTDIRALRSNGEELTMRAFPPAHTDTDISIRFATANVLHLGDTFFNGTYPFIDSSTGGNVNGMVAAAERTLSAVDADTKIVPGHGPLADRAALQRYRDMLAAIRDAVGKLKGAGKGLADVQAAKPTAAFDAVWGHGFMKPDDFVALVYGTLP